MRSDRRPLATEEFTGNCCMTHTHWWGGGEVGKRGGGCGRVERGGVGGGGIMGKVGWG